MSGFKRIVKAKQLSSKQPKKAEAVHAVNIILLIMKLLLLLIMETPALIGASV